jgi:hypothetical protein
MRISLTALNEASGCIKGGYARLAGFTAIPSSLSSKHSPASNIHDATSMPSKR